MAMSKENGGKFSEGDRRVLQLQIVLYYIHNYRMYIMEQWKVPGVKLHCANTKGFVRRVP